MKRHSSSEEDSRKNTKMARIQIDMDDSMIVASGTVMSTALERHFGYELSDKKAKSNLLKGAGRDVLEIEDKKTCMMFTFSVGAFHEIVIPTVGDWGQAKAAIKIDDLEICAEEVTPGFDENKKHMQTLVRF